ncbi:MAG: hypothetical protein ABSE86_12315 [Bryobacteraceae bacterium]
MFASRILYAACVIESNAGIFADAEAYCRRSLDIASQSKRDTRDLSLGCLALAEAQLEAGDLAHSPEAATKGRDLTAKLFGESHQDMVQALELLARVSAKDGNMTDVCADANRAVKIATALFGERSPGAAGPIRALREMDACRWAESSRNLLGFWARTRFQTRQIARTVYHSHDLDPFANRPVEDHILREALHGEHSRVTKQPDPDLRGSAETRMGQEKPEGFIGHLVKVECSFYARIGCDVLRLLI